MTIPLLTFLARYIEDQEGYRKNFDRGDAATRATMLADCGITSDDEVISAILREDEHAVGAILAQELAKYAALRRNEGGGGEPLPLWPGIPLHIDSVEPATAPVGTEVTLNVRGWYFEGHPSALDIGFGIVGRPLVRATVERCVSEGPFGRTVARVNAVFPVVGDYKVIVSNTAGSRIGSSVLPNALTVT